MTVPFTQLGKTRLRPAKFRR